MLTWAYQRKYELLCRLQEQEITVSTQRYRRTRCPKRLCEVSLDGNIPPTVTDERLFHLKGSRKPKAELG